MLLFLTEVTGGSFHFHVIYVNPSGFIYLFIPIGVLASLMQKDALRNYKITRKEI